MLHDNFTCVTILTRAATNNHFVRIFSNQSNIPISIELFVNSLVLHAAALQAALYHKCTYLNSHVLHAAVLLVSICKLVIGVKCIDEYSGYSLVKAYEYPEP